MILEFLYLKVIVSIVRRDSKTIVYIELLNKKGIVNTDKSEFETEILSLKMYEYIYSFTRESPFFYISILDTSPSQGAIPTCSKHQINSYYDLSSSEYKCYDKKWSYYTSKSDLYNIEKTYEKIGVDFIFSPFIILRNFFKDKIHENVAMYILLEEDSLSMGVFKESKLLYAEHMDISLDIDKNDLVIEETELSDINLDDDNTSIDLEKMESLDELDQLDEFGDFGDIADLDSIEELDEFDDTKETEEASEKGGIFITDSAKVHKDYQRFLLIQSSINNFYQNEKFESEFIENLYIADGACKSNDLKKFLEEEMFINVYIRKVDLCVEVSQVTKMELE